MAKNCTNYTWGKNCTSNGGGVHRCILIADHSLHKCACGWTRR